MTRETPRTRRAALALGGSALAAGLAGCVTTPPTAGSPPEAQVTVRLTNRDDAERAFEVVVRGSDTVTDRFSGTLPADASQRVELIATFRVGDGPAEFSVETAGGRTGRTWDPVECPAFRVDAAVDDGTPTFEATCDGNGGDE
ncbi:hypothetical protein ACFQRB_03275 [Halobaculum litoreum]|uniref:Lipoprotein n=1 Tax=Halobaculum litoreum TaxID=3031998 RepID=A0ABD5XUQ4_9EURY